MAQKATAVVKQGDAVARPSKIPRPLRFPLVVLLSLTLSSLLYSFASSQTADLARVSRSLDQWWQVGALVGWRTLVTLHPYLLCSLFTYGPIDSNLVLDGMEIMMEMIWQL
jgi:hypothetical protein